MRVAAWKGPFPGPASRPGRRPLIHATTSITLMRNNKIVTAMACAAASMLAGLTLAPSPPSDRRRSDDVSRELSCKPYLGPIPHTIGTAVFIHGTSPKGTERR